MAEDWVAEGKNKEDLFCTNCPSKILISRAGLYTKCELKLPQMTQLRGSSEVKTDEITECFQVRDPFQFENVGFSKTVADVKYLTCADCELGPVGWQELPIGNCFLALSRVRNGIPVTQPPVDTTR